MATPLERVRGSLGLTESGNRYDADNQLGYTGKYQFGRDRLADLGLGDLFTMEQYNRDPALQEDIFNRHIADIDSFISSRGLDKYEGQSVNGVPLTREGMYAVAHLGGKGGLEKFILSGGEYNPSDAFGTSLMDYATTHGGGPRMALAEGAPRAEQRARPLIDFAEEMKSGSSAMTELMENALRPNLPKEPPQPPRAGLAALQGQALPPGVGPAPMAPAGPLSFGPNIGPAPTGALPAPPGAQPTLNFGGAPVPQPAAPAGFQITPSPATRNVPAPAAAPSAVGGAAAPNTPADKEEAPGIFAKIAETLYPNREDPKQAFKELIGGVGVGLGQMSAGQAVDLQPYFNNIAARRQASIDSYMDQQQNEFDNKISAMNAQVSMQNAETAYERLQFDMGKTAGGPAGVPFSPETLTRYAGNPVAEPLIELMASADANDRKIGVQGFKEFLLSDAQQGSENPQAMADLYEAFASGDQQRIADTMRVHGGDLNGEDIKRIADITDPTSLQKNAIAIAGDPNVPPEVRRAMIDLAKATGGVVDGETPRQKADREFAYQTISELDDDVVQNAGLNAELIELEMLTNDMIDKNIESTVFDAWASTANSALRAVVGEGWASELGGLIGFDAETISSLERLQGAEATLALLIAQPMMEGGGSISDGERAAMLRTVARGGTTAGTRLQMIQKMKSLNTIDAIIAQKYGEGLTEDFSNSRVLRGQLRMDGAAILPEIRRANQEFIAAQNMARLPEFAPYQTMDRKVRFVKLSPKMTQAQFDTFKEAIPANANGLRAWQRVNADNTISYMLNDREINFDE